MLVKPLHIVAITINELLGNIHLTDFCGQNWFPP